VAGGKHTTILVVDVAGFSELAKADEQAAVAAVARLIERCAQSARAHSGRIFDTSGDSVLMEFTNTDKALEAGVDLVGDLDPPIRAALHVGETTALPSGDLIGAGVKIATQLQGHAKPGGVLVSEDARKALHGPLADRLALKGVIKLDKVDATIGAYELTVTARRSGRADTERARRLMRLGLAGGAALLVLVAVAVFAWPMLRGEDAPRVAVFALEAPNDSALRTLATNVSDDIGLALSASGVETVAREPNDAQGEHLRRIARAKALGAPLALDGVVERAGSAVHVVLAVTRVADRATLWTAAYEGQANALEDLRQRAAAEGVAALTCAADASRGSSAQTSTESLGLLLRACTMIDPDDAGERRALLAQALASEPNLAVAQALLALDSAEASTHGPAARRSEAREEARRQAQAAIGGDRRLGEAYLALELIEGRRNWGARESAFEQGVEHDERNATLAARNADLLIETGRIAEGLESARRGAELDPTSADRKIEVASALLFNGDPDGARAIADALETTHPSNVHVWLLRLRIALASARYEDALVLIEAPASQVRSTGARQCWTQAVEAMRAAPGSPNQRAGVMRIMACARSGDLPVQHALLLLAGLNAADDAYVLARTAFVDDQNGGHQVLFAPQTRALRRDARFMPLMRDLGLLRHWRLSGRWPDFCRDPSLPYQCEAEARRLL
jgi:adenylate cyclase